MLQLLTGLLDQHGDSAQQAALLAYLRQGEEAQPYLEVGDCQILTNIVNLNHFIEHGWGSWNISKTQGLFVLLY